MSILHIFSTYISLVVTIHLSSGQYVTVNTTSGQIRGQTFHQVVKPVVRFLGIPYARPPTGDLRFSKPVPAMKWSGIKDALHYGNSCHQVWSPFNFGAKTNQSEDCLHLNVYTTSVNSSLPVMVWIHGGGYQVGAGSQYDATFLAAKDVVSVTINYRLDAFGFLSTEDDVMPGNYGMLDQIEALKWVQNNIASFGGDPKRVTIFGESAGSSCVSLLVLSPLAKGLFDKAIMQSGVSLSHWAIHYPANALSMKTMTRLIGLSLQCPDIDNSTNLLSCLRSVDPATLLNAKINVKIAVTEPQELLMVPRVETTYGFLPDYPLNLIRRGKFNDVDSIRGSNNDEMGSQLYSNPFSIDDAKIMIGNMLQQFNELDQQNLSRLIDSYFNLTDKKSESLQKQTLEILDVVTFIAPGYYEINEIVQRSLKSHHFLYEFTHRPSYSRSPQWVSAVHGDEVPAVFNVTSSDWAEFFGAANDDDISVSDQMMTMWTNFAKTGDPTSSIPPGGSRWLPYTLNNPAYLVINTTSGMKRQLATEAQDLARFYFQFMGSLGSFFSSSLSPAI